MNWKDILKGHCSGEKMSCGCAECSERTKKAVKTDRQIEKEIAQMEQTLNQNKGRIKTRIPANPRLPPSTTGGRVVDLATYRLEQLNKIKSMPFPQNVEEFNKFKEQYKQNF